MEPFVLEIEVVVVTLNLDGLGVDVAEIVGVFLCGMRVGVVSSVKKMFIIKVRLKNKTENPHQYYLRTLMSHVVMVV